MKHITSSTVRAIGYDPETKTLKVIFNTGAEYHYEDVDQEAYDKLENAHSVGSHLHHHIKPKHAHKKVS